MEFIQIIAIVLAVFALSRIILQVKNSNMTFDAALFWVFIWISILTSVIFPSMLGKLAILTGVGRGVDVIIYLSIMMLFYLLYRTYVKMENMEREITKLVREIAINEREENKTVNKVKK
ncbi:DUF2304 domain-containing protein [Methanococcus aeolicus]|uniref:DUF2304 domain-containing protein n=1 Tax=Methanococcus aeolicus (strain ATCC BAA-1280 / DSM 17508 / OCM 812 / Nankai-3) TaxID=419665 RepID=A6UWP4_META3|nr:DUF2304 family protein [Methanococcus aeolicus]ABR56916.1 conserved hypothetical protein [Methanococcus aeolicus Nankai-3]UXM84914.1 DUF2304 family protein [Methanococcus aeolicus]